MSSPDFVQLRGISGTAVAARCKALSSPAKREFLFFLQAMSLKEGGLVRLAGDLVRMFPRRVGTPTMHSLGMAGDICYSGADLVEIDHEIEGETVEEFLDRQAEGHLVDSFGGNQPASQESAAPVPWQTKYVQCREAALKAIPPFIIELCINPRFEFSIAGEDMVSTLKVEAKLRRENTGSEESHDARITQFENIVGGLLEYKRQYENSAEASFCHTAVSRLIWDALDKALKTRTMSLINGLPGRGKTEAVRAWCECHLGVARFISLDGTSTKTAQFRELSKALGVGHSSSRKAQEMQGTVKEILQGSGIMPVIDEAHFFFEQGTRITSRPEMLDWIDTGLCNPPIPVALVTTPQFMTCMERAAIQAEWNYLQFQRRCKRTLVLPQKNSADDVEAVARHLLPGADDDIITLILGYEKLSERDLSAVGDVVREAKRIADENGDGQVSVEHVDRAIYELCDSDKPWSVLRRRVLEGLSKKKSGRRIAAALDLPQDATQTTDSTEPDAQVKSTDPRRDTLKMQAAASEQTRGMKPAELNTNLV